MHTITTERLTLRPFTEADAPFVLELLNDPSFIRYIGDKKLRTLDLVRGYIRDKFLASYGKNGFGLLRVALTHTDVPIGMCGLVSRDTLPDVDIGFAFLPAHRGAGYALEAARATLHHARDVLGIERVVAITAPDNVRSAHLLEKLGMRAKGPIHLGGDEGECILYAP